MANENKTSHNANLVTKIAGGLSVLLGLLALTGWYTVSIPLVKISPAFPAMQFNTALGFFFCGTGLLSIAFDRQRITLASAWIVFLIGLLTLAQYILNIDIGIDQLLMRDYISGATPYPGRMAPNTALNFTLTGASLMLMADKFRPEYRPPALGFIGSIIVAVSSLALSGYLVGFKSAYVWGHQIIGMALHTAAGFIFTGIGIIAFAWRDSVSRKEGGPSWLPAVIGIISLTLTLVVHQALMYQEHAYTGHPIPVSNVVVGMGLILSSLLTLSIYLAQKSKRQLKTLVMAQKALQENEQRLKEAQNIAHIGNWDCDILKNELIWSDEIYHIFGLVPQQLGVAYEEFINAIHPDDRELVIKSVNEALHENKTYDIDYRIVLPDGSEKFVHEQARIICDEAGRPVRLAGTIQDITRRKKDEEKLEEQADELLRSNEELERFAYIASHDLQEPLRTISSFTQLMARRYKGKLDSDADEFISFIVDGASRMQGLINDLLTYSRVGTRSKEFAVTDCEVVLNNVLAGLREAVNESCAVVTHDPLPTIAADPTQMEQLFQNLISNAIKFRGDEPPRIHVAAERGKHEWLFSVKDNGIGIAPDYFDRIFIIFQRLHGKKEYPGSGIGLAICKKIAERHGGCIWLSSEKGKGSTFYFTIHDRGVK